jgi:hypothetical protein
MTVYTTPIDTDAAGRLSAAGFVIDTADGWVAEYTAGNRAVRVERIPDGWLVFRVVIAGAFESRDPAGYREALTDAVQLALELAAEVNDRMRVVGLVTAEVLRRAS